MDVKKLFFRNEGQAKTFYSVITGIIAGTVNGLFGGGGGMIVVPMLMIFLKKEAKTAHATAILIILPLSIVSAIFYALFGSLDVSVALPTTIGVAVGGAIGAFLLSKLSSKYIVIIFAAVMVAAGVKMLAF